MKRFPLFLLLLLATRASAAPPREVVAAIPAGALSLRSETKPIGPKGAPVLLHLWVIPKGRDTQAMRDFGEKPKTGPITRDEITQGPSLTTSPFGLDIWSQASGKWKKLNSVRFLQSKDVQEITPRWLDPKTKTRPVLLMHFGYTHWHEWEVVTFPTGLSGPARSQSFFWGGEGGYGVFQRFDTTDARGLLQVSEEETEPNKTIHRFYRWNGREFLDKSRPWFVLMGSAKTRAGAEAMRMKLGFGDVAASSDYPKLAPGVWIIVNDRFASAKEAAGRVADLQKNGMRAYFKKAF